MYKARVIKIPGPKNFKSGSGESPNNNTRFSYFEVIAGRTRAVLKTPRFFETSGRGLARTHLFQRIFFHRLDNNKPTCYRPVNARTAHGCRIITCACACVCVEGVRTSAGGRERERFSERII